MNHLFSKHVYLFLVLPFLACEQSGTNTQSPVSGNSAQFTSAGNSDARLADDFNAYWYQGEAEISSYKLQQARYGEIHQGHAVLIYVTEDFSNKKQVKLDNPQAAGEDRVPILKLNFTKKFNTGIYPYSIMQSIFTPVDRNKFPHSLKTTMSSQEWCGHVFTQLNSRKNHFEVSGFSYFESEGDASFNLGKNLLEDELWTMIRINPKNLPIGEVQLIPSVMYSRLRHEKLEPQQAKLTLNENEKGMSYLIEYESGERSLQINFTKMFPYKIVSWEEKYTSGWGSDAVNLTTKGTLMENIKSDYWSRHSNADLPLRKKLNLPD